MTIQAALEQREKLERLFDAQEECSLDPSRIEEFLASGYEHPFLLLDLDIVRQKYHRFRAAMPRVEPHYAVKANPDVRVLRALQQENCQFEIASIKELETLCSIGVDPRAIQYSNPVKPASYIQAAASKGVQWFAFDSVNELEKIRRLVPEAKLYLRFDTPNIGSDWPLTGKFGMKMRDIQSTLEVAVRLNANVCGVTFHVGSQCRNIDNWTQAIEASKKIFKMMRESGLTPEFLNIGGGYPVRLAKPIPTIEYIGESIEEALSTVDKDIRVIAEPGRYMVSDAAYFVCQVIGKAYRDEERWLFLDAGVFGGLMECSQGIQYDVQVPHKSGPLAPWYLAGPSCDSVDVLGRMHMLPESVAEGDLLYFPNAGAYTTVYANEFNGFPLPKTVVINEKSY